MATCTVSGTFTDPFGNAVSGSMVRFNIDSPLLDTSGRLIVPKEVLTSTASDGTWSLHLTQNISGVLTLDLVPAATSPVVKYKFSLIIPSTATATFSNVWADSQVLVGNTYPLQFNNIQGYVSYGQISPGVPNQAVILDSSGALSGVSPGTSGNVLTSNGTAWTSATSTSTGTVTSASVVAANGLAGTVATPTTTPAITLSTTVTGIVKGNGATLSAAVAGDFPTLNQNTSGNAATVTTNANLTGPITSTGNATAVAAQTGAGSTFVMQASPTLTTPVIGAATGTSLSVSGQLTSTVTTGTAPLVISSTTQVANLNAATAGSAAVYSGGALTVAQTTVGAQAISASAIDWSTGNAFTKTLGANTTFTFSNQTSGQTAVVRLTNTASNWTVTWPTVKWVSATAPTMTVGAFSDVYTFFYDGTNTYGSAVQNMS